MMLSSLSKSTRLFCLWMVGSPWAVIPSGSETATPILFEPTSSPIMREPMAAPVVSEGTARLYGPYTPEKVDYDIAHGDRGDFPQPDRPLRGRASPSAAPLGDESARYRSHPCPLLFRRNRPRHHARFHTAGLRPRPGRRFLHASSSAPPRSRRARGAHAHSDRRRCGLLLSQPGLGLPAGSAQIQRQDP